MKEHMHSVAEDAKQKGRSAISHQQHQVAEMLRHVCEALKGASEKLHKEDDETVANYTDAISQRLDSAADYVEQMDVSEVIDNVEHFARRQPAIFLGGLFLAGLATARFLKASQSSSSSSHRHSSSSSGNWGEMNPQSQSSGGMSSRTSEGSTGGSMQQASQRQQSMGAASAPAPSAGPRKIAGSQPQPQPQTRQPSPPGSSGPAATPPSGATFPSSSEGPIPGPRRAESTSSDSGIGGSSRSQETRPGTIPERQRQENKGNKGEKREVDR